VIDFIVYILKMDNMFQGKTILITWGTWFLGHALTKELLKYNPHSIRIYSRDEVKHFMMQEQFNNDERLRFLIGDIRDYERLEKALKWVEYVIDAAALKRLDLIEYNTEEAVKTNVVWSLNLVRACENNKVKKVVFISTDKACSPVNTYGACKFVSERIMTESNYSNGASGTIYTCVRYGNVISSTWSIVPILLNKIKKNEPFTLTDDTMTRFLITEGEAVQLILKAFTYWIWGEVFIPILPSVKIVDLMNAIKKVNNYDKEIIKIWIRPGEKIHELMINESEGNRIIKLENMYIIKSMIEIYKDETKDYKAKYEEVSLWTYSSANSLITVDQIIEKFREYLLVKN
jgi:UDP-N-acetylglucosamine 4,6-dehydratase/5-epimerase